MHALQAALIVDTEDRRKKFEDLFRDVLLVSKEPSTKNTTVIAEIHRIQDALNRLSDINTEAYSEISSLDGKEFAIQVKKKTKDGNTRVSSKVLFDMKQNSSTPLSFFRSSKTYTSPTMLLFIHQVCYSDK